MRPRLSATTAATAMLTTVLLVLAGSGGGCSTSPSVDVTFDHNADFSPLKTYRWTDGRESGVAGRKIAGRTVGEIVTTGADRELSAKGLHRADEGAVDFLMRYDVALDYRQRDVPPDTDFDARSNYDEPPAHNIVPPPGPVKETYVEGTVALEALEALDARENHALWRATAPVILRPTDPPDRRVRRLEGVVRRLLGQFPPQAKPQR